MPPFLAACRWRAFPLLELLVVLAILIDIRVLAAVCPRAGGEVIDDF